MRQANDSPSLMDTIRAHPVRSALLATPVVLFAICGAIAQSWQSFTDKKIPDWFSQNFGWVFMKFSIWQIWGFIVSIVAVYCVVVYILFRPRRSRFGEYTELLSKLAEGKRQQSSEKPSGGIWAALQSRVNEITRESIRESAVRIENERRDRARAVSDLVDRAEERITKDGISYPLFALQRAGAATLKTEQEFLDACEALHHRHFAHPLKTFADTHIEWLKMMRFANDEELSLSSDVAVCECLRKFRLAGLSEKLDAKITDGELAIDGLKDRIQKLERAEFTPFQAILEGSNNEDFKFAIALTNIGTRIARGVRVRGFVWNEQLTGDLRVMGDQLANDVAPGTRIESCFLSHLNIQKSKPHFVVLSITYKPNGNANPIKQTFYFKFRGAKKGKFDRQLYIATEIEKQAIERRFAEEMDRAGFTA